jgi:hypothetical protein
MTVNFSHVSNGMTRFPPNVEQLRVEFEPSATGLVARRNDIELRFPLNEGDRRHLARLLLAHRIAPLDAP